MAGTADVPFPDIPNRSPSILFSTDSGRGPYPRTQGFVNTR
jgi:hypothetical protein